ncbi:MAG: DUF932 domain-containing protein [Planctomycetota bacterium]|nr:DUF932 domain-containing protein [Planctomycetota bacterium]
MQSTLEAKGLRRAPNSTLGDLMDVVASRRQSQHDFVARADQLYVDDKSGCLVARQAGYREFRLRTLATNQLANRLGVPGQYLLKCPSELVAENVNHWLSEQPDRQFLVRCNGDEVRAVLSSHYSPVDHELLLSWVGESVGRDAQVRYELSEEQLVLQLVNRREHGTVHDRLHTGVNIRNSEVGLSCVEVSGLLFRTICLNGLILRGGEENWTRRHIGNVELADEVRNAISRVQDAAAAGTSRFAGLQSIRVPNMTALFERITRHYELTEAEHNTVLAAHSIEPGDTLYAGVNAVTRAGNAYDLPLDSRMKLQEIGGRGRSTLAERNKGSREGRWTPFPQLRRASRRGCTPHAGPDWRANVHGGTRWGSCSACP